MAAPSPEWAAYFKTIQESLANEADIKKHELALKKEKLELEHLKVRRKINLMQATRKNAAAMTAVTSASSEVSSATTIATAVGTTAGTTTWCLLPACNAHQKSVLVPDKCEVCKTRYLHHMCQSTWESHLGLNNMNLTKRCFVCSTNHTKCTWPGCRLIPWRGGGDRRTLMGCQRCGAHVLHVSCQTAFFNYFEPLWPLQTIINYRIDSYVDLTYFYVVFGRSRSIQKGKHWRVLVAKLSQILS